MSSVLPPDKAVEIVLRLVLDGVRQVVQEELDERTQRAPQLDFLSFEEAARVAGVSKSTLGRWAGRGLLRVSGIGRTRRILRSELEHVLLMAGTAADGGKTTRERAEAIVERHVVSARRR